MITINIFGDFLCKSDSSQITADKSLTDFLRDSHVNILNFEAPLDCDSDPINKSGPSHSQHPSAIDWLSKNKFSIISLANNHIYDYGEQGLNNTMTKFREKGIKTIGAGTFEEAYRPVILDIDNIKVAFLAFSHFEFGVLSDEWDSRFTKGVAWINHPKVDSVICSIRPKVDIVVAIPHVGIEGIEQPLPEWRDRFRNLIDLGCDAVVASHPHIIQGYEIYKDKPICYSLGNFYFSKNQSMPQYWYYSLMAKIMIRKSDKKVTIQMIPLRFNEGSITVCYNDQLVSSYLKRVQHTLLNVDEYLSKINYDCMQSIKDYESLFYLGGYPNLSNITLRRFAKIIYYYITGKKYCILHALNNIRCESHRFCIIRALKFKHKIQ